MTPLPRATCPICRADVALRRGGEIREHPDHRHELYSVPGAVRDGRVPTCFGSGQVVGMAELAAGSVLAEVPDAGERLR